MLWTLNQSKSEYDKGVSVRWGIWGRMHFLSFVSKQFTSCWAADSCGIRTISNDLTLAPNKPHFIITSYLDSTINIMVTYIKSAYVDMLSSFINFQNLKSSKDFQEPPRSLWKPRFASDSLVSVKKRFRNSRCSSAVLWVPSLGQIGLGQCRPHKWLPDHLVPVGGLRA